MTTKFREQDGVTLFLDATHHSLFKVNHAIPPFGDHMNKRVNAVVYVVEILQCILLGGGLGGVDEPLDFRAQLLATCSFHKERQSKESKFVFHWKRATVDLL